ncbi:MAG TPA: hypothetical protein VKE98_16060 [Gemmataceae bacterium]|nr:hypothetical protein [Gemmataceae bacterium]
MSFADIANLIADVLQAAHFFTGHGLSLIWEHHAVEEVPWEIYQGRLLPAAHTRQHKTFAAWNIYLKEGTSRSGEPVLAVLLDSAEGKLHVTRAILSYVWEGYDAGNNVILSRETTRWVRELVGSMNLDQFPSEDDMRKALSSMIFQAVVGTSRLPLTSVEAPLPAYSLGQLAFFDPHSADPSMKSYQDLIIGGLGTDLSWSELARLLEIVLRTIQPEEIADAARMFTEHWKDRGRIPALLRTLFNDVSLSPYTHFVDNALVFVQCLVEQEALTIDNQVDFLSYLLRQLGRHLTAYDLITFHHRGANYPDALLLDAVLKAYLALAESKPDLFVGEEKAARLRCSALRQGCLLRRFYEGHLVPDAPTSPGENARVLPPPYVRVPEEQLLEPAKRKKRLYDGDPLTGLIGNAARRILQQSMEDLFQSEELRELGRAIFIDRPIDESALLSHEAFSRAIAARRLIELDRLAKELRLEFPLEALQAKLQEVTVAGLFIQEIRSPNKPIVSLADARRVSEDFVVIRTLPGSLVPLAARLDIKKIRLLVRLRDRENLDGVLAIFDEKMNKESHWGARSASEGGPR